MAQEEMTTRPCRKCGSPDLHPSSARSGDWSCRKCKAAYHRQYRSTRRKLFSEKEKLRRANMPPDAKERTLRYQRSVSRRFGISAAELESLHQSQGGRCAICGDEQSAKSTKVRRLAVDHCHRTGKVRGLLCLNCNTGLGRFKDMPELLLNAVNYLKRNQ